MNITYFSNQFADHQGHGLARYSRELFFALKAIAQADTVITPVSAWSSKTPEELASWQATTGLKLLPWGRRFTPATWAFLCRPTIEHWLPATDIVHAVALGYPIATKKPLVVTVHDLGPLTHPKFFQNTKPWIMQKALDQAVKQAVAIICVSQSTADELLEYVGPSIEDRVQVVYEGVSEHFFQPIDEQCLDLLDNMPPTGVPFILATGKISPRKNIHGLVEALSRLVDDIPHHLVLIGGDGWDMEVVRKQLANPKIRERVHFSGYVTDEQLRALYKRASIYVHPSLYEGFGLTVLEAMAVGCPVITSNVYSLPEVAGDAALLVDPTDRYSLTEAIYDLCNNESLVDQLQHKGIKRAKTFQWKNCARQIIDVYKVCETK